MVEVLGYRRNFEIDGLLFPEAWDRYGGGVTMKLQNEVSPGLFYLPGPSSTNLLSPHEGRRWLERSHRTSLDNSQPSALCLHSRTLLEHPLVPGTALDTGDGMGWSLCLPATQGLAV